MLQESKQFRLVLELKQLQAVHWLPAEHLVRAVMVLLHWVKVLLQIQHKPMTERRKQIMTNPKKFWHWKNEANAEPEAERVLELYGTIAEESWFDDDITPQLFRDELFAGSGPVTIWVNSPGGDCVAASQIYAMLMDYKNDVTVKIDGVAASAASVIAMAGTTVLMAPTAIMMIHNPATLAIGDSAEMQKAIEMLSPRGCRRARSPSAL